VDAFRLGGGLTRSRSAGQIGGPACLETRTEYEPLEPIAKDAENDETVVAAGRSEAALWVTPTILILILLLLLLLLLTWLCFYCRKAKDKSAGMVVFSTKRGNKDQGTEVQCRARICKRLRSPGIGSEESISPAYMKHGAPVRQIGFSYRPARQGIWAP
jgi:hypothetical protein